MNKKYSEIIFIGTGSGKASVKRYHSSILFKTGKHNLLIDAGDGISRALINSNIDFNMIDSILFSHYHADHFAGLASLITQMKLINRTEPLKLFTHKNLIEPLESLLNSVYMFKENLNFDLNIFGFEFENNICADYGINFTAKKNSHIYQKENLKHYPAELFVSSSFLLEVDKEKIIYTSDIGSKDDIYLFADKNIACMIIECTHIAVDEIYEALIKISPQKLFITHISDEIEHALENWHNKLNEDEKQKVVVCYDGLIFHLKEL